MNTCDPQMGWAFRACAQITKKRTPLSRLTSIKINYMNHLFAFHGFDYHLISYNKCYFQIREVVKKHLSNQNVLRGK
ncbi:hypothetical protein HanXRQr2_Chr14g0628801 [Helianthus annuus]|uniref:Uncharacterized protein n=1 Tax=Helianthus annuus TaxID=4232 RepID=A0A9K3H523_HELAN|nr:hypothetical protein HanXRQr2_Chr14g0628801 [Helianthus annuus]KAJ0839115.1 hypothetical protein HanPSC8_Chr14g0603061 [Helianthus annuus]